MQKDIYYKLTWHKAGADDYFCTLEFFPTTPICTGITELYLNSNVIDRLKEITIHDGFSTIDSRAFENCHAVEKVTLPESLVEIGRNAFSGCSSLQFINLPSRLKAIKNAAFHSCKSLKSVDIPDGVEDLGYGAFYFCKNIKSVKIGKSVKSISYHTFDQCTSLEDVVFADESVVENINVSAFSNCFSLESIKLPDSLKVIESYAFAYDRSLKNIEFPDGLERLGSRAFSCCKSLQSIVLPNNIKVLPATIFEECRNLSNVILPKNLKVIEDNAFNYCRSLTNIDLPNKLETIGEEVFCGTGIEYIDIPSSVISLNVWAFNQAPLKEIRLINPHKDLLIRPNVKISRKKFESMKYICFGKDGKDVYLIGDDNESLLKSCYYQKIDDNVYKYISYNYRKNYVKAQMLKEKKKIKYIPQGYILDLFPDTEFINFFKNKNDVRYRSLIYSLGFNMLDDDHIVNACSALFKIYYALGGFSKNKGDCERAYDYILNCVAVPDNIRDKWLTDSPYMIGDDLHARFSSFVLNGSYNDTFAKFFMKYYHKNHDFMCFNLGEEFGGIEIKDYLASAHNNFDTITKLYPYRHVNTNQERSLLSPRFVAEHCSKMVYKSVDEGNESLADLVGNYGYTQKQFDVMQMVFNHAKNIKDKAVLSADTSNDHFVIKFRLLKKDDPLGFVLGDITNCCQKMGADAESCVIDGYSNPKSGFIVFEENNNNKESKGARILGQAYTWYDDKTKTVCLDNIEIPKKVLNELNSGDKCDKDISFSNFLLALRECANAIIVSMNSRGIEVNRVTLGKNLNDIGMAVLSKSFGKPITNRLASRDDYWGYSDANNAQYVIVDKGKDNEDEYLPL